jgi:hypothetical protein
MTSMGITATTSSCLLSSDTTRPTHLSRSNDRLIRWLDRPEQASRAAASDGAELTAAPLTNGQPKSSLDPLF